MLSTSKCSCSHFRAQRSTDNTIYSDPSLICLQLSHKDVFLGYFADRREEIDSLMSGQTLTIQDACCLRNGKELIRFSKKFCEQMDALKAKGYLPIKATIRHIVFWQGKDSDNEIKIILPDIEFSRDKASNHKI